MTKKEAENLAGKVIIAIILLAIAAYALYSRIQSDRESDAFSRKAPDWSRGH